MVRLSSRLFMLCNRDLIVNRLLFYSGCNLLLFPQTRQLQQLQPATHATYQKSATCCYRLKSLKPLPSLGLYLFRQNMPPYSYLVSYLSYLKDR